jgi:DNA-binding GntR family transcriptional regulator
MMRPSVKRKRLLGNISVTTASLGGSLADSVYEQVLQAINTGDLRPGDALREVDLAARLGVSRTPVREALQRLESEEIVVKRDRSLVVPLVDEKQIFELYAMREALEGAAAGLAARSASDAEIEMLTQLLAEESAIPEDASDLHAAANKNFHAAIYRAANNRYLLKSLSALQDAISRLNATTFSYPGRPKRAIREHRLIQRAITDRDPVAAEQAARQHIREALRYRMMLLNDAQRQQ